MLDIDAATLITPCAGEVLEKMFFQPVEPCQDIDHRAHTLTQVKVAFAGDLVGELRMAISENEARRLAADFLGEGSCEDLSALQVTEVMRELTNMLCGYLLSSHKHQGNFNIFEPASLPSDAPVDHGPAWQWFQLDDGCLGIYLAIV